MKNVELLDFSNKWVDDETWPHFSKMFKTIKKITSLNLSNLEPGDTMFFEPKRIMATYQPWTYPDALYACFGLGKCAPCMQ